LLFTGVARFLAFFFGVADAGCFAFFFFFKMVKFPNVNSAMGNARV
jgi:hypothetical protein